MSILTPVRVDSALVPLALSVFGEIFPDEEVLPFDVHDNWFAASVGKDDLMYWLHLDQGNKPVGISGLYVEAADPESAWLGWFGVLPAHRRRGHATAMLSHFEAAARDLGFRHARIYTNTGNAPARALYGKNGYSPEEFHGEVPDYVAGDIILYGKPLSGEPVPWNDRHLDF